MSNFYPKSSYFSLPLDLNVEDAASAQIRHFVSRERRLFITRLQLFQTRLTSLMPYSISPAHFNMKLRCSFVVFHLCQTYRKSLFSSFDLYTICLKRCQQKISPNVLNVEDAAFAQIRWFVSCERGFFCNAPAVISNLTDQPYAVYEPVLGFCCCYLDECSFLASPVSLCGFIITL